MWYGYHILSKEVLMQTENDDDLYGGQRSSEVKYNICAMATIFGQKNCWCKLRMMMTFHGGQKSSEVKCGQTMLPNLIARTAEENLGCLTFMEVKGQQRSNTVNNICIHVPLWYLVSRWGLGSKVCMHHFGCGNGMNWIKWYYMIVKVKNWNLLIFNLFSGNAFLNIVILYYLLMRRDVWFENHLVYFFIFIFFFWIV